MKTIVCLFVLLLFSGQFASGKSHNVEEITYQPKDKEIIDDILQKFKSDKNLSTAALIIKIGKYLAGTPYVAHTLELEPEHLVVNLRELDCTTFAENCLAIARTIKSKKPSFKTFTDELKYMRYHNGKISGYPSRIHYFSDWIYENSQKKLVNNVTSSISDAIFPLDIDFMSTHTDNYRQLKNNASFIPDIVKNEKAISKRTMYFIPENKVATVEDKLYDGDIAGITTTIKGIDIQHVVILFKQSGRVHILHASQSVGKVLVSDETLEDYLLKSKSATGIMVARPI